MVIYMIADGMTDGTIARLMGWSMTRVATFGKARRYPPTQGRMERRLTRMRQKNFERLTAAWEERRREG